MSVYIYIYRRKGEGGRGIEKNHGKTTEISASLAFLTLPMEQRQLLKHIIK